MTARRASGTARLIALATLMRPGLAPPGAARICQQLLGDQSRVVAAVQSRSGRLFGAALEKLTLPGVVEHWLKRKCAIDQLARAASAEGFTQLLVLGAGLDTLSFRMAEENLFQRVISADHPATLSALSAKAGQVEFVPIDLSVDEPLPEVSPLPTLIVLEGLLMYLPEAAVNRLLSRLARLAIPRGRIVASWMLERPGRPLGFREQSWLIGAWLRWRGEPMLWGSTPGRLVALLHALGWSEARIVRFALESEQLTVADRRTPL